MKFTWHYIKQGVTVRVRRVDLVHLDTQQQTSVHAVASTCIVYQENDIWKLRKGWEREEIQIPAPRILTFYEPQ